MEAFVLFFCENQTLKIFNSQIFSLQGALIYMRVVTCKGVNDSKITDTIKANRHFYEGPLAPLFFFFTENAYII